jgi:hypothetical protein
VEEGGGGERGEGKEEGGGREGGRGSRSLGDEEEGGGLPKRDPERASSIWGRRESASLPPHLECAFRSPPPALSNSRFQSHRARFASHRTRHNPRRPLSHRHCSHTNPRVQLEGIRALAPGPAVPPPHAAPAELCRPRPRGSTPRPPSNAAQTCGDPAVTAAAGGSSPHAASVSWRLVHPSRSAGESPSS